MEQIEVEKRFTYHAPNAGQVQRHTDIREYAREFCEMLLDSTPESREQSLAITKLEECVMWANAAIARRE